MIEAEQTEAADGPPVRNDRLIAVAAGSRRHREVRALDTLPAELLDEVEHFFRSCNDIKGKKSQTLARSGPDRARALVKAAMEKLK